MIIASSFTAPENISSILVIQLGDIGDVIWTFPTLFALKTTYPHAKLSLLMREGRTELLEGLQDIDNFFEVRKYRGSYFKRIWDQFIFLKALRSQRFDLLFDLRADDRGAVMARISGATVRGALYYEDVPFWRNRMFTHLTEPAISYEMKGPAEQSLRIVKSFGIGKDLKIPDFPVNEAIRERVRAMLPIDLASQSWITISPFSRWSYKDWPYDNWIEIFNWLWSEYKIAVLIVGAKGERSKTDEIIQTCSGRAYNFAGRTRLSELVELVRMSRMHIGVDTGAVHIAAAVGTPTITIYGPSYSEGWAHPGRKHRVVFPDMECVPCHQVGCDNQHRSICLETLKVERVRMTIREALPEVL
ncbi:MAG: glycosyltransferase family 9 protein [Syntrophales bacterium]|nr:glycosyltransferase family 9 protein [Syntrophales bacterium]